MRERTFQLHETMRVRPPTASYRHWLEYPILVFTILVIATAPAVILLFYTAAQGGRITINIEEGSDEESILALLIILLALIAGFLLFMAAIALLTLYTARRRLNGLRRSSVRVGPAQFPELYALAEEARTTLGVDAAVNLYLFDASKVQHGLGDIAVRGFTQPYFIIISTYLVSEMTPRELLYLLGCEYGHVKLGHVRMLTIIDGLSGGLGHVPFLGGFVHLVFTAWTRLAVYSADRAGLIAGRRLADAYGALVKLMIDARHFNAINHAELAQQAKRTRGGIGGLINRTTMPFDTQPLGRFDRLLPFALSPAFQVFCPDADLDFPYLENWR